MAKPYLSITNFVKDPTRAKRHSLSIESHKRVLVLRREEDTDEKAEIIGNAKGKAKIALAALDCLPALELKEIWGYDALTLLNQLEEYIENNEEE